MENGTGAVKDERKIKDLLWNCRSYGSTMERILKSKTSIMILDYLTTETEITIITEGKDQVFSLKELEGYLIRTDALDWELDFSDGSGEHVQNVGQMSMEEYFDTSRSRILMDLQGFLEIKKGDQWTSNVIGKILNKAI
jgi:hypothetical protein